MKPKKVFVAIKNGELIGVYSTLMMLCDELKEKDGDFKSYWTIVREKDKLEEGFEVDGYTLYSTALRVKPSDIGKRGNPALLVKK